MQDCMTERRPWAQWAAAPRAGASTRHCGWVKVVLPWSQRPVHKEKMLCPTPAWFAQVQLQVPSLLHAPIHDTHPKRVCRKGRQRGGGAGAFSLTRLVSAAAEPAHIHPAPLLSHLMNRSPGCSAHKEQRLLP